MKITNNFAETFKNLSESVRITTYQFERDILQEKLDKIKSDISKTKVDWPWIVGDINNLIITANYLIIRSRELCLEKASKFRTDLENIEQSSLEVLEDLIKLKKKISLLHPDELINIIYEEIKEEAPYCWQDDLTEDFLIELASDKGLKFIDQSNLGRDEVSLAAEIINGLNSSFANVKEITKIPFKDFSTLFVDADVALEWDFWSPSRNVEYAVEKGLSVK